MFEQPLGDQDHLLRSLPFGKNHLRHSMAQGAVMIDFGEAQILEGHVPKPAHRMLDIHLSTAHLFEKEPQLILIHEARISECSCRIAREPKYQNIRLPF